MQFKLWNISFSSLDTPQCVGGMCRPVLAPISDRNIPFPLFRFQTRRPVSQKFREIEFIAKNLNYICKTSL